MMYSRFAAAGWPYGNTQNMPTCLQKAGTGCYSHTSTIQQINAVAALWTTQIVQPLQTARSKCVHLLYTQPESLQHSSTNSPTSTPELPGAAECLLPHPAVAAGAAVQA